MSLMTIDHLRKEGVHNFIIWTILKKKITIDEKSINNPL